MDISKELDGSISIVKPNQPDKSNFKKRRMKAIKTNIRILKINKNNALKDSECDIETNESSQFNNSEERKSHEVSDLELPAEAKDKTEDSDSRQQVRKNNVNVNIEAVVDPLEIELLDPDNLFGHKNVKSSQNIESTESTLSRGNRDYQDHEEIIPSRTYGNQKVDHVEQNTLNFNLSNTRGGHNILNSRRDHSDSKVETTMTGLIDNKIDHVDRKMDVYNQLKMSLLNKNKKQKVRQSDLNIGGLNQMAFAPHSYFGHEEDWTDWKAMKPRKVSGDLHDPHGEYNGQAKSFKMPTLNLLSHGESCHCDSSPSSLPLGPSASTQIPCKNCCRSFDSRDLAYVFLFGLVVGLLVIIATTILYSVFFVVRKSCCFPPDNPYEITLTRDHHYRESEECKCCSKCRKCCDCGSEHEPQRHSKKKNVNSRIFGRSHSDVVPSSKWRLTPRHFSCEAIGHLFRKS